MGPLEGGRLDFPTPSAGPGRCAPRLRLSQACASSWLQAVVLLTTPLEKFDAFASTYAFQRSLLPGCYVELCGGSLQDATIFIET